jgi:hypothetical protein
VPYGELEPLSNDEFQRLYRGESTPDDFPPEVRRQKTNAYFERLLQEDPQQWQAAFEAASSMWLVRMKAENGRVTPYNPIGRRFKRKQLKLMAQQWGFDSMGMNFAEHAESADTLLDRAEALARLGENLRRSGVV